VSVIEPAGQSVHAATFDFFEYLPTSHSVHVTAPVLLPLSVIEPAAHVMQSDASSEATIPTYSPAGQSVHDATFDAVEYLPATHTVHVVAPALVPVSVIEPAAHTLQAATFDAA
jgi:hypothetical protein